MLRGGLGDLGLFLKGNAQVIFLTLAFFATGALAVESVPPASSMPWWGWPLGLFVICFLLGIVAMPSGAGGGVRFVPIVGGFFPFHLDFVRGAGLLVALGQRPGGRRRQPTSWSSAVSAIEGFPSARQGICGTSWHRPMCQR